MPEPYEALTEALDIAEVRQLKFPETIDQLGDSAILLASDGALNLYEGLLVEHFLPTTVSPDSNTSLMWQTRTKLSEMLKPPKFYGRMGKIVVEHMKEPYATMLKTPRVGNTPYEQQVKDGLLGFDITAQLLSSRGNAGTVKTSMWIYQKKSSRRHTGEYARRIAKPRKRTEEFDALLEESIENGLKIAKWAMRHPYRGASESNRSSH